MWIVKGKSIQMTEGDYGVSLPITISGTTFTASDEVKLTIKADVNGESVLEVVFSNIQNNTVNLSLSESDSEKLKVGTYVYSLDYQNNSFMCNIIAASPFKVVEKA